MTHFTSCPPLHMAVCDNNLADVKRLCTNENVNDTMGTQYSTPLHCAVLYNASTDIITHLINNGCDINKKNTGGDSAIFVAAMEGRKKLVEFLLLKGAEIDQNSLDSSAPYLKENHPKILELLQNPKALAQSSYTWPKANKNSKLTQRLPHTSTEMISFSKK